MMFTASAGCAIILVLELAVVVFAPACSPDVAPDTEVVGSLMLVGASDSHLLISCRARGPPGWDQDQRGGVVTALSESPLLLMPSRHTSSDGP